MACLHPVAAVEGDRMTCRDCGLFLRDLSSAKTTEAEEAKKLEKRLEDMEVVRIREKRRMEAGDKRAFVEKWAPEFMKAILPSPSEWYKTLSLYRLSCGTRLTA